MTKHLIADAVIVGAGIHGSSAALHLARAGLKCLVLEQAHPGRHASGVNAGGVRRLGRHLAEIPLSLKSMELWHDIRALVDDDCGFERTGQLKVAESGEELEELEKRVAQLQRHGFSHEQIISREELRTLAPAISDHCCGAIYCADDGHAKPFRSVRAFYRAATRAGARFFFNHQVQQLKHQGNTWKVETPGLRLEAPLLVNAAGAWGARLAEQLGAVVPLEPTALMLMISERVKPFCRPVVGAAGRTLSFKQFTNGTVMIGGGLKGKVDFENHRAQVDLPLLATNARTALDIFPLMRNARITRFWAGIEGFTPDGIPVIDKDPVYPGAYHVFGFSAHGYQLGPITGRIIQELVESGQSSLPIEPFSIKRFTSSTDKKAV